MENKLFLKEEQLVIFKSWIERGKVFIYRDVYEKNLVVKIPIQAEDLVVESVVDGKHESIRIPISEEWVENVKHKNILNDIKIYKRYFEEIEHIPVELNREKLTVEEHLY